MDENDVFNNFVCRGCGRPELHKFCPAWGTPKFMTGEVFTKEDEVKYKEMRDKAIEESKNSPCSLD